MAITPSDSYYCQLAEQLETIGKSDELVQCNDETRFRLLEAVKLALPQLEKQDDAIQRVLYTSFELSAAKIAANMNLFQKLCEAKHPLTTKDVCDPLGADPKLMERILKFMASMQLIKEIDTGLFGPSRTTRLLNDPGVYGGIYTNTSIIGPSTLVLPEWLKRTNYQTPTKIEESAFSEGHGVKQGIFQWFGEHDEAMHQFQQWMTQQRFGDELWLDGFPFDEFVLQEADPETPLFVDVGGGIGHQCANLLKAYPAAAGRVVLQDQEHVLKSALPESGLTNQAIDFFTAQPIKNARIYYMRNVLHDWTDEYCCIILKVLKSAMGPNSMIFVDEMVVPDKGAHRIAMQVDMTMLANCIAEERSGARWQELFDKAGLKIKRRFQYSPILGDCLTAVVPV